MTNPLLEKLEENDVEVEDTLDRLAGDEEMYLEFLYKLPDNTNYVNLKKAVEANDTKTAMEEVHALKGISLNLGILPLTDACMDMLMDFRSGNTEQAMQEIQGVEEQFTRYTEMIKEYK